MHLPALSQTIGLSLLAILLIAPDLSAQEAADQPAAQTGGLPEIADEPRTYDPAKYVPPKLAAPATVDLSDSSLREVARWIQEERQIPVLLDSAALSDEGILLVEPVSDRLDNEPVYLLLNRLRSLGLDWYVEDDVVHVTTKLIASTERMSTRPYNVGDLLDADYDWGALSDTITDATEGPWLDIDGEGGAFEWLGDVLFVRQSDRMHRQVAGLMDALRNHGRQTFTLDPPQHIALREKLNENVSVKFVDTPLKAAIEELSEKTGADMRLDMPSLRDEGIRDREPVSLTLSDRKLSTVLHVLLSDLGLTWILRDGVMWITCKLNSQEFQKTAVYDVRDLCRNEEESDELLSAIQNQTRGPWMEIDGEGGVIVFAKTGTLAIRHSETGLQEVGNLLQTYRTALLSSKRRKRDEVDPNEVLTRYYRMHEGIANDLSVVLPQLVQPESWKSEARPDAPGRIVKVSSEPDLLDAKGKVVHAIGDSARTGALVLSRSVLIITQTRATHEEIVKIIRRAEKGDPPEEIQQPAARGGGGGGGGGFGGGYLFSR